MITVLLALVVGLLVGGLLAYRLFHAAATATGRRALDQLQGTLDGLESVYSIKVATYEAQRELAVLSTRSGAAAPPEPAEPLGLHMPRSPRTDS